MEIGLGFDLLGVGQEWFAVKYWRPLPWARQCELDRTKRTGLVEADNTLVILLIYLSAFLFVLASWTVQIVFEAGIDMSAMGCSMAGTLCLGAYVGTKVSPSVTSYEVSSNNYSGSE